jgi:hypothetical protein
LPPIPKDLLETAHFNLTLDEAQFIIDRLVAHQPSSLLAFLARSGSGEADCDNIWEHPQFVDFPHQTRILVGHAAVFSSVIHGAWILYNLLLSHMRKKSEWIERAKRSNGFLLLLYFNILVRIYHSIVGIFVGIFVGIL